MSGSHGSSGMSTNVVGVLIIVVIIIIGFATGGDIFRGGTSTSNSTSSSSRNSNQRDYPNEQNSQNASRDYSDAKVSISSVSNPGTFNEHVRLSTDLDDGESINITGWRLRSTVTGSVLHIGGGARVPIVGLRDQSPIILDGRDRVIVSAGASPINTSFRINKCAGYLEEKKNFEPSIRTSCPAPIEDAPPLSREIDDECLDYIEDLPTCQIPKERDYKAEDVSLSRACENFLATKVNYENCVVNHISDKDFFKDEWRVYTNQRGIFWRDKRETIELIDTAGRVVDSYSY